MEALGLRRTVSRSGLLAMRSNASSGRMWNRRVAAARACAVKGSKSLVPQVIPLLRDPRGGVIEAAHQALKELSGQDFGPKANASREERIQAAQQWTDWWNKRPKKDEP